MKRAVFPFVVLALILIACTPNNQTTKTNFSKAANPPPPSPTVALQLKDANQLLGQRRCAEAANLYLKFLEKYPKDPGAWNFLGLAYLCDGKGQKALEAFHQALMFSPMYTDVHNNVGVTYMEMKNYDEAKKEFMKALEDVNYSVTGPYFNMAKMAYLQQHYEEARALSKKVMDLSPKQAAPILLYGLSLERLNRIDEACDSYRTLLKIAPNNVEASFYLANLLVQKKQVCEARILYNKVVDADPLGELGQKSIAALKNLNCPTK